MTYRKALWGIAVDQYGYVTTRQAERAGIPAVELAKLAYRGHLSNISYGLYRMNDLPTTEWDPFAAAVLLLGEDAYLMGESTLALYGLASINPRLIWVGTPRRTRAGHPAWLRIIKRDRGAEKLTVYEGIPTVTVGQALLDCRGRVMTGRLVEAARRAFDEGLVASGERGTLVDALTSPGPGGWVTDENL